MADTVLLVDFENVGKIDLGAVPVGVRVPFFFGASQKTVPTARVLSRRVPDGVSSNPLRGAFEGQRV